MTRLAPAAFCLALHATPVQLHQHMLAFSTARCCPVCANILYSFIGCHYCASAWQDQPTCWLSDMSVQVTVQRIKLCDAIGSSASLGEQRIILNRPDTVAHQHIAGPICANQLVHISVCPVDFGNMALKTVFANLYQFTTGLTTFPASTA